jgi:DnaJ-class molecular chaperone
LFERQDDDLIHRIDLSLEEALCNGISRSLTTLDNQTLPIKLKTLPDSNKCVIRGYGLPNQKTGQKGDLYIEFKVKFPKNLQDDEKATIRSILKAADQRLRK